MKVRTVAMMLLGAAFVCAPDPSFAQNRKGSPAVRLVGRPLSQPAGRSATPPDGLPRGLVPRDARPTAVGATRGRLQPAALVRSVLAEANAVRRRAGSRPLVVDEKLASAARRYARELAAREDLEHVSRTPGRRTFRDRIHAEGARARVAGENIARLTASAERLPDRVVKAWLKSPGHRRNLVDPIFARTGIGVWPGDDGLWYVVQVYATRR